MEPTNKAPREIGATPLKEILGNKPDYQKQIAKVRTVFETLEMGDFKDETLSDIIENGPAEILENYKSQVTKEIEGSGIKSVRMKEILLQGYNDAATDFNNAHDALIEAVEVKRKEIASQVILRAGLTMAACGFEKTYANSTEPGSLFKRLKLGKNSWIATDSKSWSFEYCEAMMKPDMGEVYLYASCPADMGPAKIVVAYKPLPNTPTHYLILIKKADYRDIDFR